MNVPGRGLDLADAAGGGCGDGDVSGAGMDGKALLRAERAGNVAGGRGDCERGGVAALERVVAGGGGRAERPLDGDAAQIQIAGGRLDRERPGAEVAEPDAAGRAAAGAMRKIPFYSS